MGTAEHDLPLMRQLNQDLHSAIMEAVENQLLKETLASVRLRIERSIDVFIRDDLARFQTSVDEHKLILQALLSRDADRVEGGDA